MTIDKINHLYAFVTVKGAYEGIVALESPINHVVTCVPMVTHDDELLPSLKLIAKQLVEKSGDTIKLVKFENRTEIEKI